MLSIWGPVSRGKRLCGAKVMSSAITSKATSCRNIWDTKWVGGSADGPVPSPWTQPVVVFCFFFFHQRKQINSYI